jgi:hypothetical protein
MAESDPRMVRAAVLQVVSSTTERAYKEAKATAGQDLASGDRRTVRSPLDGRRIGAVYRTDPKPVAVITDENALLDWYAERYPHLVKREYKIRETRISEAIEVLYDHAPELLEPIRTLDPATRRQLEADVKRFGYGLGPGSEMDIPGIERQTKEGVVSCEPADDALGVVLDLFAASRVGLDGHVRPALESSGGNDAA